MAPPRYRQSVGPALIDTSLPSTGAEDLGNRLAQYSRRIGNTATQYGAALRRQQGEQEGLREGAAGNPQPRTGFAAITPFGQAYNNSAEAAYSAKVQTDINETADRLALEHEADPEGFSAAMDAVAVQLYKTVPEPFRPLVGTVLNGRKSAVAARLAQQRKIRVDNETLAATLQGMENGAQAAVEAASKLPGAEGDDLLKGYIAENRKRWEVLAREGIIAPTDVLKYDAAFRKSVTEGLDNYEVVSVTERLTDLANVDVQAAAAAMELVWQNEDLTTAQKEAIQDSFNSTVSDIHGRRSRIYAEQTARIAERLAARDTSESLVTEAEALYRNGAYTVDQLEGVRAGRMRNIKAAQDTQDSIGVVKRSIASGVPLDPRNADDRKNVDAYFSAVVANAGFQAGSEQWRQAAIQVYQATNILPETASSWARSKMLSQADAPGAALAARFMAAATEANPLAAPYTVEDANTSSFIYQVNAATNAGVDPIVAVETARANLNIPKEQRELLDTRYTAGKFEQTNETALRQFMYTEGSGMDYAPWYLPGDPLPETPLAMQAEYNSLVKTYFRLNGGDIEGARRQAAGVVKRTYRVSDVNGKPEIIKFGPPKGTGPMLRQVLNDALTANGFTGDPNTVKLRPSWVSDSTQGTAWFLVHENEDGDVVDVVRGKRNQPAVFVMPNEAVASTARERVRQQTIEDLKAKREENKRLEQVTRDAARSLRQGDVEGRP